MAHTNPLSQDGRSADFPPTSSGTSSSSYYEAQDICKVGVRLPPFWPEEPEIWFMQVESQFAISGITADSTKFHYVIGQLEQRYTREVKDLILKPPTNNKYEKLKEELVKRLASSNEKRLQQLLMHEEQGDRRPSQFLRHLQGLVTIPMPIVLFQAKTELSGVPWERRL